MNNYKGGYSLIDCGSMNLLAQSAQTIDGLYDQVKTAYKSNKPIIAENCVYGEGVKMTPIAVMVIEEAGDVCPSMDDGVDPAVFPPLWVLKCE